MDESTKLSGDDIKEITLKAVSDQLDLPDTTIKNLEVRSQLGMYYIFTGNCTFLTFKKIFVCFSFGKICVVHT